VTTNTQYTADSWLLMKPLGYSLNCTPLGPITSTKSTHSNNNNNNNNNKFILTIIKAFQLIKVLYGKLHHNNEEIKMRE